MRTGPGGTAVTSLVSDPHGTATIAVANTTAATLTVRRFDPYANPRGPQVTWPGDHGFLDKPVDATGLVAIGARYYDPALGRFISVDPVMDLTDPQQWAAYSYANNNPTTYSDPTGLIPMIDGLYGAKAASQQRTANPAPPAPEPPVCVRTSYGCVGGSQPGSSRRSTPAAPVDHLAVNASSPDQIAYNAAWNEANIERILPEQFGFQQWAWDAGQWVNRGSQLLLLWTAAGGTLPGANRLGRVRPITTPTPAPDPPTPAPKGGVYTLRDEVDNVVRTGRTNDLVRREAQHADDPVLGGYRFKVEYRTDIYAEQRGLEGVLYDRYPGAQVANGGLNRIRAISPSNPNLITYRQAASDYLARLGEE